MSPQFENFREFGFCDKLPSRDPRQGGEDIAADAASVPFRGYANEYGGSYAQMGDRESVSMSGQASCEQRFKSYDPASGTYRGYDGKRHACR